MTSQGLQDSPSLLILSTAREAHDLLREADKWVSCRFQEQSLKKVERCAHQGLCTEHAQSSLVQLLQGPQAFHDHTHKVGGVCLELEMGEMTGYYFLPASIKLIPSCRLS